MCYGGLVFCFGFFFYCGCYGVVGFGLFCCVVLFVYY